LTGKAGQLSSGSAMNLSPKQISAIKAYTGAGFRAINRYLRHGAAANQATKDCIAAIDEALIANPAAAEVTVFRGIGEDYAEALVASGLAVGDIIQDKGFLSTSEHKSVARSFMKDDAGMLFAIRIDVGALALDIAAFSNYPDEAEILLARDASLRVIDYDAAEDAVILEFVGNG
jgi:ADP-ribosyltransferase exoenzyme